MLAVAKKELSDLFYVLVAWSIFGAAGIVWYWSVDGDMHGKTVVQMEQSNIHSKGDALSRSIRPKISYTQ